jgi:hypothetical protein
VERIVAKGLIAALLGVSIQLAGAPVLKAEPEQDVLSGRSGVVGVETLRRLDFTRGTVEASARPKSALQEPEASRSDSGLPSTLELITLVLMLVLLAELCGGAIAERRRLRPASGAATTAFRSCGGAGRGREPGLSLPVPGTLGLRGGETAGTSTHEGLSGKRRQDPAPSRPPMRRSTTGATSWT